MENSNFGDSGNLNNANISFTMDDALAKAMKELNEANSFFDRWVNENPQKATPTNTEFKLVKQNIKLLRLKVRELVAMKEEFQNTLLFADNPMENAELEVKNPYVTKARTTNIVETRRNNPLGNRPKNKISLG